LVTEAEIVQAALAEHGPEGAEKFIQEVVWRGYFKGWLERRPGVWRSYLDGLQADRAALGKDRALARQVANAEAGQTGLDCFDAWAQELTQTGYMHNHARMWFASIWVFTFGLPWRLGADFFLRHLLDGDPASNTLGWRWVAGLHTRGKIYEAQAWNIAKFTNGRFSPRDVDLAHGVAALDHTEPEGLPPVQPVRNFIAPAPLMPTALLITEEDGCLEDFDPLALRVVGAATLSASHLRSDLDVSPLVSGFEDGALADGATRLGLGTEVTQMRAGVPSDLARWAKDLGAAQIATGFVPQGPLRDWLDEAAPALAEAGIALTEWQRDWDRAIWPHATAGFFKVKKQIPRIIETMEPAL
jgi:deoxyribodipyrimidine photo-lyase